MATVGQQVGWVEDAPPCAPPIPRENGAESGLFGRGNGGSRSGAGEFSTLGVDTGRSELARQEDVYQVRFSSPTPAPPIESPVNRRSALSQDFELGSSAAAIVTTIRELLAQDRVLAARKLIDAFPSNQVGDAALRHLRLVLAEPVVRRRMPGGTVRTADFRWLRENAGNYTGKWVALADGTLLAADRSLTDLRRRLRRLAPHAKPLFHRL